MRACEARAEDEVTRAVVHNVVVVQGGFNVKFGRPQASFQATSDVEEVTHFQEMNSTGQVLGQNDISHHFIN